MRCTSYTGLFDRFNNIGQLTGTTRTGCGQNGRGRTFYRAPDHVRKWRIYKYPAQGNLTMIQTNPVDRSGRR